MPIHDWTRVPAGLFHHFHQDWSIEIARALNRGILPGSFSALVEQRVDGPEPDVIAVEIPSNQSDEGLTGTAVMTHPRTRLIQRVPDDAARYAEKANRISIQHALGQVIAVIELVSPGNKSSRHALRSFVEKSAALLRSGIHLLIVDLFPPSERNPQGLHKAIIDEFADEPFSLPAETPLTLVAYHVSQEITAYLETVAVGSELPAMPLFLSRTAHVLVPLEATYMATWSACPASIRDAVGIAS